MPESESRLTEQQASYVSERSEQLYTVLTDAANAAVNFLFLVNSGGAVATLTFLGRAESVRAMLTPKLALSCFVAGLVFVGVLRAFRVHDYQRAFDAWHKDYGKFLSGQLTWTQLIGREEARSGTSAWEYIFGYASFISILAGAAEGAYALFFAQ